MTTPPTTRHEIDKRFAYYRPQSKEVARRFPQIRGAVRAAARVIVDSTVPSREQSLALTKLEEAMFWASAAVARMEGELIPESVEEPSPRSWDSTLEADAEKDES